VLKSDEEKSVEAVDISVPACLYYSAKRWFDDMEEQAWNLSS
jgi:hypothetical protein